MQARTITGCWNISPTTNLITKGRTGVLQCKNQKGIILTKSRLTAPVKRQIIMYSLCNALRKAQHHFWGILVQNAHIVSLQPSLSQQGSPKKTSDNCKWRDILQNNWHLLFKSVGVTEDKMAQLGRNWGDKITKGSVGLWTGARSRKGHWWESWRYSNKVCRWVTSTVPVLTSWFWSFDCNYVKW